MNLAPCIDLGPIVEALRPVEKVHATLHGERKGFFMSDATRALGSLAKASEAAVALTLAGILDGEFVVIDGGEAHTLYRLVESVKSALH